MIPQTNWVERKFNFDFPLGYFSCILERVRGTPARLEELVGSLPGETLTKRVNNGWSIQEHAGHLYDLDELHEKRLEDFLAGAKTLRPADMENQKTYDANYNAHSIHNILKMFREARQKFATRLENMDERQLALDAVHPRLNRQMRVVDMAFFVAEHDDHHLAKISGLIKHIPKIQS